MSPLVLPAELTSLEAIRRFIAEACDAAGLDGTAAYNLTLAVDEIVTNIILYGYADHGPGAEVRLEAEVAATELRLVIEDRGIPYDPTTRVMAEGESEKPLEERDIGGWGVYLALNSVDRFEYERNGERNINRFFMNRRP